MMPWAHGTDIRTRVLSGEVLWLPVWPVVRRDGWKRSIALYNVHVNRINANAGSTGNTYYVLMLGPYLCA
jgi:hypothetical protein